MVDIEKINSRYEPTNPIGQFSRTAGRFANDFLELSELQAQLAKLELEAVLKSSVTSIVITVVGSCLLLASLPVFLFGIAGALVWACAIEPWVAQVIVGGIVGLMSIAMVVSATKGLLRQNNAFSRSLAELKQNIDWVKRMVRSIS